MKFYVTGKREKLFDFIEYIELLGYKYSDKEELTNFNIVEVRNSDKTWQWVYDAETSFNVEWQAEVIDSFLEKPEKDIVNEMFTNFDYYHGVNDIEVNEPEIEFNINISNSEFQSWINNQKSKESFGYKEEDNKTKYSELDWDYIDSMSNRMSSNTKYPSDNWKKEMDIKKLAESAMRHARKILQAVDGDEESLQDHAVALGCNGMMINYQIKEK